MTNYGAFIFNGSIPLWINQGFEGVHNIFAYDLLHYFRITEKYILNLYFSMLHIFLVLHISPYRTKHFVYIICETDIPAFPIALENALLKVSNQVCLIR